MRKISFESMDLTEINGRVTEGGLHPPTPLLREMLKEWGELLWRAHINHKM